jgi:hypothetical protein
MMEDRSMATTPCQITVRGIRENPSITEINVRSGPNATYTLLFKAAVGMGGLPVLDVRPDDKKASLNGKTYQWFKALFPNGQEGWVRDDLVDIVGDGRRYGYAIISTMTPAFSLTRNTAVAVIAPGQEVVAPVGQVAAVVPAAPVPAPSIVPAPAPVPAVVSVSPEPSPAPAPAPATPATDGKDRIRKAAFNITAAFEGGGYSAYQTYDSGIISYGRFQFTLAAGSLLTVLNRYLERSNTATAQELRGYMSRLSAKDESLRNDSRLKALCIKAADETVMQEVQDEVAVEGYYQPVFELSIAPRGIMMPLTQALIFDMAINHGRFNHLLPKTEEVLGVPNKSRLGTNGISEEKFVRTLANVRRDNLYALADKLKLPGLKKRGDFWVGLVNAEDWNLRGDAAGNVNVNGKIVQVAKP